MHTVYSAAHAVDAHMIVHLLAQADIPALVFGEFLTGAAGELPPGNLVRVVVPDARHIDEALRLIAEWESASPCEDDAGEGDFADPDGLPAPA